MITPTALSPELPGRLADALRSGRFAVTAEIAPPRGADLVPVRRAAEHLRGWVDAVNVTDNAGANVRMSSLAGSLALLEEGVDPVMQMTCRDRNRIALQSDLLSASALGGPNLVLMTGGRPEQGDHPDAAAVVDLDSGGLMSAARTLRDDATLMSGRAVDPAPRYLLGAVDSPGPSADRFAQKVDGGAQFVQTQFVFDIATFRGWLGQVRDRGLDTRCGVLAGVGPIRSLRALEFMSSIPGVVIPEALERRLRGVPSDKVAAEGVAACVETLRELRELPGVAGVHVMVVGDERGVPEILEVAGLSRTS